MNGWLVTRVKLPPFIVTLGTWNIFFALNLWLSGAQSIRSADIDANAPLLKFFGNTIEIGAARLTYGTVLMVLVFMALWYVLNKTAWGRHVYMIGDDKEAAELAGIRTDRTLRQVYMLAGFICALAAWASIGRVGSISPQSFFEGNLQSITAVVIGGISLFGGRGSIMGALFGALIVGVFQSGPAAARGRCALAGLRHRLAHHHSRSPSTSGSERCRHDRAPAQGPWPRETLWPRHRA